MIGMFLLALLFVFLANLLIPFVWNLTEVNIKNHMQLFRYNAYKPRLIRNILFLIPQLLPWILQLLVAILIINSLIKTNPLPASWQLSNTYLLLKSADVPLMSLSGFMYYFFWPLCFLALGLVFYFYLKHKYQTMKNDNNLSLQNIIVKEDWLTIVMVAQIIFCNLFCYAIFRTCLKIVFLNLNLNLIMFMRVYFLSYLVLIILARCALTEKLIWRVVFALITAGLVLGICFFSWK